MEEWDCEENQGKRRDQIETSYMIMTIVMILFASLIIGNSIYLFLK